jgi:Protein of unknown function (DUF3617)
MKTISAPLVLSITMLALSVAPARAADRVHAGQWEITIGNGAPGTAMRSCVTAAHANVANADDKTFQQYLVKAAEEVGCTVKDVKVTGNQVTIDSVCAGEPNMNTTTYHGDWYEQVNSNGMKIRATRIGACP